MDSRRPESVGPIEDWKEMDVLLTGRMHSDENDLLAGPRTVVDNAELDNTLA